VLDQRSCPVVAHINAQFFASTETFIYNYISNFKRTIPICLSLDGQIVNPNQFPFPAHQCFGFEPPQLKKNLKDWLWVNLRQTIVGFMRPGLRQRSIDRLFWAYKILRRQNSILIHAHFGTVGWQILPLRDWLNVPLVVTFYGHDVAPDNSLRGSNWVIGRKELFRVGDLFLAEGPFMRQRLVELGCSPEKVELQRIGIDVDKIPFHVRKAKSGNRVVILFAGRFCEKKGLIYSLAAIQKLLKLRVDFEFRIVGDGELRTEVETYIHNYNLGEKVKLLGFLEHANYLEELDRADIFLHPSITASDGDSEGGAPTVLLEAQASGLPIVSTYHCDIPNVTVPGASALLVPEKDSDALASALSNLLEHQTIWEAMGQTGRTFVEQNHNIVDLAKRLEDKYFQLWASRQKNNDVDL
jgi:colanic acid/amylovoran biosynthesis glycosyltransferase